MTSFLAPPAADGYRLEDILSVLRNDLVGRMTRIMADKRPEAQHVMRNDIEILRRIEECIEFAQASSRILDRSFGPHVPGEPRIGKGYDQD